MHFEVGRMRGCTCQAMNFRSTATATQHFHLVSGSAPPCTNTIANEWFFFKTLNAIHFNPLTCKIERCSALSPLANDRAHYNSSLRATIGKSPQPPTMFLHSFDVVLNGFSDFNACRRARSVLPRLQWIYCTAKCRRFRERCIWWRR